MSVFATPDFGASAGIYLLLALIWCMIVALTSCGTAWGIGLCRSKLPAKRKYGVLVILVSLSMPLFCCLAPPHFVWLVYGNYPVGTRARTGIKEGMSRDEVQAILGRPHERSSHRDGQDWYYWVDSYGIQWFGVKFGQDGRVTRTYGN